MKMSRSRPLTSIKSRDVVAVVVVVVSGLLAYTGTVPSQVATVVLLGTAAAYGLLSRRGERKREREARQLRRLATPGEGGNGDGEE